MDKEKLKETKELLLSLKRAYDNELIDMAIEALSEEPRKHGHWEDCSNGWMCSVCNEDATHSTDYCPHCGAKMDEVSDGEK